MAISFTTSGANPIDGSFMRTRRGSHIKPRAIASICCWPPDSVPGARARAVLVEQMAAIALRLAERAYVLENGRVKLSGTGAELARMPKVRHAYLGG
jgi:hypothetical protein